MRASTIFTVAGVTFVTGAIAYALWFDSKRRNDAEFRRRLRKEKKRVEKSTAQQQSESSESLSASAGQTTVTQADLRAAIEKVKAEPIPPTPEEKETYFMQQVSTGEALCTQGAAFALPAAMCFFRALRVYPTPVELIMIYQQTIPEPIFKMIVEMTQLDMKARIEGYWDTFPPKGMNVNVKPVDITDASGATARKRVLVVNKDFSAGDVIYKEQPIVTALDADLEGSGEYCSYCLRSMDPATAIRPSDDKLGVAYCSKECELKATTQHQAFLFASDSLVPSDGTQTNAPETAAKRQEAQEAFVNLLKKSGRAAPLLLTRFVARHVTGEFAKTALGTVTAPAVDFGDPAYTVFDHMERLRYLELTVQEEETKIVQNLFEFTVPGLEGVVQDERYATLKGKMEYNAYGVYYGEGRTDKPETEERPEDRERTRTAIGTSKQIGSGFYFVSSYMQHNCAPSARATFPDATADLVLVAERDLKAGDEVTVAYVDVSQHEGESVTEARRRRRHEIARGWRFACPCERCVEENENKEEEPAPMQDESKVETSVQRRDGEEIPSFIASID